MSGIAGKSRVSLAGGASQHSSVDRIEELGIVGAGGGGFPAAAKFRTKVSLVIANAAECEPLLHCQGGSRSGAARKKLNGLGYNSAFNLGSYRRAAEIVGSNQDSCAR
jgi:hypothetical protein